MNPFKDTDEGAPRDVPPLTIMSLAIRSVVNHQLNKQEIVCGSIRVWEDSKLGLLPFGSCFLTWYFVGKIDDATPPEKQRFTSHTIVRPLGKYPTGFEAKARAEPSKIIPVPSERALLGNLLCKRPF